MLTRTLGLVGGALLLAAVPVATWPQSLDQNRGSYLSARTPWGDPNLQGVWDRRTITPLERPQRFADKAFFNADEIRAYERASAAKEDGRPLDSERSGISVHDPDDLDYGSKVVATGRTSLVVEPANGRIPAYTAMANARLVAAQEARKARGPADSWTDRSLSERCITWGVPRGMLPQPYNNNLKIIQTPDHVMLYIEMVHDVRIIPIDGRPHLPAAVALWHGDSRGYWEDDTLVVETRNFSPKTSFRGAADKLLLEERFRRTVDDLLEYTMTITDDTTWEQPWSVSFPMPRGDQPIYEFACHEGNYGLRNILSVARSLEQQQREGGGQ